MSRFRCYEGTAWRNCISTSPTNSSAATQTANAAVTYLTGSTIPIPAGGLQGPSGVGSNGTTITWHIAMSKTATGTTAPAFNVYVGPNGTTADTIRQTITQTRAQTAAVDQADYYITVHVTAGGAATVLLGNLSMKHTAASAGFANGTGSLVYGGFGTNTSAAFDSTVAGQKIGLGVNPGAGVFYILGVQTTTENF